MIFPVILLAGLYFAPESPWWLVRKGRKEEARKILLRLSGETTDVDLQLQQIQDTIILEDTFAANSTYADCFRGERSARRSARNDVDVMMGVRHESEAHDDRVHGVRAPAGGR